MDDAAPFDIGLDRLRSRHGIKWRKFPDTLAMWVADMDFDPPPAVLEELGGFVDRGDFGYAGFGDELADAYVTWQQRHGWSPDADRVHAFTSALHALEIVLWHLTDPGDGVVVFTPVYFPFLTAIEASGRRRVDVPLDPDGWRIDPDRLEAAVDEGTKLVLFCHPHNPTGRVYDSEELAAVADVAERHDLLVISDEIWGDLTYHDSSGGSTFVPLALADERFGGRLVTIGAASKTFNMAGLRCAVAHVDHRATNDVLASMPPHLCGSPSTVGVAATLAAWRHGAGWLDGVRAELAARRAQIAARVDGLPGVRFDPPEATYLAWLDFRGAGLGADPAAPLLEGGVALSAGLPFGGSSEGFARLNFATTEAVLDEALDLIATTVRSAA